MAKNPCAAYEVSTRKRFVFRLTTPPTILRVCCALVLGGILVAGLWPFHAPKNEVSWLSNANGVFLGDYGSLLSAGAFKPGNSNSGICLEIWLEPSDVNDAGTILSFYSPDPDSTSFAVRQSLDDVALVRKNLGDKRRAKSSRIYGNHVFRPGKTVFLTITSGQRGTSIYLDGVLARMSSDFRLSSKDFTGQLVVGNSSVNTDTWSGQLKGLAIYNREPTANEVAGNHQSWLESGQPIHSSTDSAIALYLFNEGGGDVVHNRVDSTTNLAIPGRFFVLHEPFLERPWNEYYPGWDYWKDVAINIAGFIPLGFFFYGYLSVLRRLERPTVATVAFGFAVSLTIEVLQAFLPTRNSGMTDLITNTLGTALGALLCLWSTSMFSFPKKDHRSASIPRNTENLQLIG
jgi:hypothetical protein